MVIVTILEPVLRLEDPRLVFSALTMKEMRERERERGRETNRQTDRQYRKISKNEKWA